MNIEKLDMFLILSNIIVIVILVFHYRWIFRGKGDLVVRGKRKLTVFYWIIIISSIYMISWIVRPPYNLREDLRSLSGVLMGLFLLSKVFESYTIHREYIYGKKRIYTWEKIEGYEWRGTKEYKGLGGNRVYHILVFILKNHISKKKKDVYIEINEKDKDKTHKFLQETIRW